MENSKDKKAVTLSFISPNDIKVTKNDLTLFTTIVIVTNLVDNQLFQTKLFDEKWQHKSVAILLGVALHGLLTNQISSAINTQLNLHKSRVSLAVYDLVKFGTIFTSQRAIVNYIEGKKIVFDKDWMTESSAIIAGYGVFSVGVEQMLPKLSKTMQPVLNDTVKVTMGAIAGNYALDGEINKRHLMSLSGLLLSFLIFNLFTKKLVETPEPCKPIEHENVEHDKEKK
jgi:hypothetical protein